MLVQAWLKTTRMPESFGSKQLLHKNAARGVMSAVSGE